VVGRLSSLSSEYSFQKLYKSKRSPVLVDHRRWVYDRVNKQAVRDRIVDVADRIASMNLLYKDYPDVRITRIGRPGHKHVFSKQLKGPPVHTFHYTHSSPKPESLATLCAAISVLNSQCAEVARNSVEPLNWNYSCSCCGCYGGCSGRGRSTS